VGSSWRHEPLQQRHLSHVTLRVIWHGSCFSRRTLLSWLAYGWPDVQLGVAKLQSGLAVVLANITNEPNFAELLADVAEHIQLLANIARGCWRQWFTHVAGLQPGVAKPCYLGHDTKLLTSLSQLVSDIA
jgi:hypothetical protein